MVDAVVAAAWAHLDDRVAAGDLIQEQADQMIADALAAHATPHEWPAGPGHADRHNSRRGHDAAAIAS